MNRKYLYPLLIILVTAALWYVEKNVGANNEGYPSALTGEKATAGGKFGTVVLPSVTAGGRIVEHRYFTLSYNEEHEQAEWVAYELAKSHLSKNNFDRPYFVEDGSVKTKSADWRNYKNSGYDRGHLCPAGDRRFNYSAYRETFLTSNISPQEKKFNAGIWNRLEQKTRDWAQKKNGVYVVTGGILNGKTRTIGYENVTVPGAFYKIVLDKAGGGYDAIAFIIPNRASDASFYDHTVTIDEIEAQTGIDFFNKLPDSTETALEAKMAGKGWRGR